MMLRSLPVILFTALLAAAPARAASVNISIHLGDLVPAGLGLMPGMVIPGTVTYNGALVPTVGAFTLNPVNDPGLTIAFSLAGTAFDQDHDTDPDFPALYFTNGTLSGINYYADNHHPASDENGYVQIEGNSTGTSFTYSFDGFGEYTGDVTWSVPVTPVPEPSSALFLGLATLICFRRQVRR